MYKVKYHKLIKKDIKNFSNELKEIIRKKHIQTILKAPYNNPNLKGLMKDFKKYIFTFKRVSYRIIYKIEGDEKLIKIYIIDKREEVYEKIIRRLKFTE